jgi:hypothetical protein
MESLIALDRAIGSYLALMKLLALATDGNESNRKLTV